MPRVKISTNVEGVLELPAGEGRGPGVVIVQEWWGVNDQIQQTARRWAEEGFVAIVPDLYHGKLAKAAAEAAAMMKALDFGKAIGEVSEALHFVRGHERCTGKVALTGYCMGGALTFATAVNVPGTIACAIPFYGLPGELDWSKIDAPIQAHFAQHDDWATVEGAKQIEAAVQVPMELHVYDAQHAFCNEARPEVYNADACRQAWGRAVAFARLHTA